MENEKWIFKFQFSNKNFYHFSIFNCESKLKYLKMSFSIPILKWKLNGTFGARITFLFQFFNFSKKWKQEFEKSHFILLFYNKRSTNLRCCYFSLCISMIIKSQKIYIYIYFFSTFLLSIPKKNGWPFRYTHCYSY